MGEGAAEHMRRRGLAQLFVAVAERRAPQPGHALDIGLAVIVVDEDSLAALEHERAALPQGREIGIGMDEGLDIADGEIAEEGHGTVLSDCCASTPAAATLIRQSLYSEYSRAQWASIGRDRGNGTAWAGRPAR